MPTEGIATFAFGHHAPDGVAHSNLLAASADPNPERREPTPVSRERTGDNAAPDGAQMGATRDFLGATD